MSLLHLQKEIENSRGERPLRVELHPGDHPVTSGKGWRHCQGRCLWTRASGQGRKQSEMKVLIVSQNDKIGFPLQGKTSELDELLKIKVIKRK